MPTRNVLLLVVDSLRASAIASPATATPFFDSLHREAVSFTRAYATECWTLPSHVSMFTGLLPAQHGAHFQSTAYTGVAPTIAEDLARAGFATESVSRNSIFDGSVPGVLRGFETVTIPLSERAAGLDPASLFLALSKPRVRRQIRASGFFSALQRSNRDFLRRFTRAMLLPADVQALDHLVDRARSLRRSGRPYFLFCNLYDVHAPYAPSLDSMWRPLWPASGWIENAVAPLALAHLGRHEYLRPGFRFSDYTRRMLLRRYHRAVELMDAKLARFWREARAAGVLEDTCVILCSDHGEAFGEHGLYLHDASVYQTHLHVPLWVHHPDVAPIRVEDVVSLRDLHGLMRCVGTGGSLESTILSASYRARHRIALAQHYHYPHVPDAQPRYRQDIMAAIGREAKVIVRREGIERYDLARDHGESRPAPGDLSEFALACRREDASEDEAMTVRGMLETWIAQEGRRVVAR